MGNQSILFIWQNFSRAVFKKFRTKGGATYGRKGQGRHQDCDGLVKAPSRMWGKKGGGRVQTPKTKNESEPKKESETDLRALGRGWAEKDRGGKTLLKV